jgi:hypothetical protein
MWAGRGIFHRMWVGVGWGGQGDSRGGAWAKSMCLIIIGGVSGSGWR